MTELLQVPAGPHASRYSTGQHGKAGEMTDAAGQPEWLWTWSGKFFGYRESDDLWTHDGRHVGRFHGDEIYGPNGRYLGMRTDDDRLITVTSRRGQSQAGFVPDAPRQGLRLRRQRFWYATPIGYADFPLPEKLP
jgi:hypothetical protein